MSPVVLAPVSTAYCSLSRAPPPDSVKNQPGMVRALVVLPAVLERVSKFWVTADPRVVRLTHCAAAERAPNRTTARRTTDNKARSGFSMVDLPTGARIWQPAAVTRQANGRFPGKHTRVQAKW